MQWEAVLKLPPAIAVFKAKDLDPTKLGNSGERKWGAASTQSSW